MSGLSAGSFESLIEVGDDIVDVFDTDGNTDQIGADAGGDLFGFGKLTVGHAGGMQHAGTDVGDVNGDGKLTQDDVRELARLKNGNGRKHTANQLKAGDFNGNGKLDNADYQALRALLKEKGVL